MQSFCQCNLPCLPTLYCFGTAHLMGWHLRQSEEKPTKKSPVSCSFLSGLVAQCLSGTTHLQQPQEQQKKKKQTMWTMRWRSWCLPWPHEAFPEDNAYLSVVLFVFGNATFVIPCSGVSHRIDMGQGSCDRRRIRQQYLRPSTSS